MVADEGRIVWIDNVKGLLLLFTCTSHIMVRPWMVDQILSPTPTYYVPLFIFISGYLCKSNRYATTWGGYVDLVYRRFRVLLVPYFFFSLIGFVTGYFSGEDIGLMLWSALYCGCSCHATVPMYFVSLLFVVSVAFTWVTWNKYLSKPLSLSTIILLLVLLWLYTKNLHVVLPWFLKNLPFSGSFFLLGYLVKTLVLKYENAINSGRTIARIVCVGLFLIGCWGLLNPIKDTILSILCPVSLMTSIIMVFGLIAANTSWGNALVNSKCRFLTFISTNGVVILGAHNVINGLYHTLLKYCHVEFGVLPSFISTFVVVYGTLFFLVVPFMNKYMRFVLGKY